MPGSPVEVTHVYADACKSEGRLETGRPARRECQSFVRGSREPGRHRGRDELVSGLDRLGDPPAGQMVEIREDAGPRPIRRAGMERRVRCGSGPIRRKRPSSPSHRATGAWRTYSDTTARRRVQRDFGPRRPTQTRTPSTRPSCHASLADAERALETRGPAVTAEPHADRRPWLRAGDTGGSDWLGLRTGISSISAGLSAVVPATPILRAEIRRKPAPARA